MKSLLILLIPVIVRASEMAPNQERSRNLLLTSLVCTTKILCTAYPNCLEYKCELALYYGFLREEYHAEPLWEEVLEKDPDHEIAQKGLGNTYYYNLAMSLHDAQNKHSQGQTISDLRCDVQGKYTQNQTLSEVCYNEGRNYALKALSGSAHFTLNDENVAELFKRYGEQEDSESQQKNDSFSTD